MKTNILVIPCATQLGVEQFYSLEYNKHFNLVGASHNKKDLLYKNFIQLKNSLDTNLFIQEVIDLVKENSIDVILTSHDEVNYILKNTPFLSDLIPGSSTEVTNICRFKSKTYNLLNNNPQIKNYIPKYELISNKFLKPDKGQGSREVFKLSQPYVACEYLPGKEYTIDCFTNSKGNLIYNSSRLRKKIENGISETTQKIYSETLDKLSHLINDVFNFRGAWFYQVKLDKNNNFKLLEVSPRIAGGSNINRLNGINLTLLTLYQHLGINITLNPQTLVNEVKRKSPKYNLEYSTIFLDYDDTFPFVFDIIKSLDKEIIIITRSKVNINVPYKVIYVKDNELKSKVINNLNLPNSIFIDDSFSERKDVLSNCQIPCLTPEETKYLI